MLNNGEDPGSEPDSDPKEKRIRESHKVPGSTDPDSEHGLWDGGEVD